MAFSFGNQHPRLNKPKLPKPRPIWGGLGQQWGAGPAKGAASPFDPPKTVAPYVTPPPDESWKDQTYFDTTSGISKNLGNLKTYLVDAGNATGSDYGIQFDRDPNDPLKATNFRIADDVDVTNPFSRAALLKRSYQQAQAGNTNSMAARGQLYSGALQNAINETGRQNLQATDSLIKDFSGKFGDLYQKWLEGSNTATADNTGAQTAAIDRHINDSAVPVAYKDIAFKDTGAAGLKVEAGPNGFIVKDSKGDVIKGATVHVVGKRRFIRVPR